MALIKLWIKHQMVYGQSVWCQIKIFASAGASQQQLLGLYKEDREVEPHRNPKLATWKEDLAAHTEKLEEAKKVNSPSVSAYSIHNTQGGIPRYICELAILQRRGAQSRCITLL